VRRKAVVAISIVIVIFTAMGLYVYERDKVTPSDEVNQATYVVKDVLKNANFKAENPTVTIHSINTRKEDIFTEIKIPKKYNINV